MSLCTQCGNAIIRESLTPGVCLVCHETQRAAGIASEEVVIAKLLERCKSLTFDDEAHNENWKNQIAHDLNFILTRVEYCLEMEEGDETEISFAESALRIVERVAEFEQITEVDEKLDAEEKLQVEPHHAGDDENLK